MIYRIIYIFLHSSYFLASFFLGGFQNSISPLVVLYAPVPLLGFCLLGHKLDRAQQTGIYTYKIKDILELLTINAIFFSMNMLFSSAFKVEDSIVLLYFCFLLIISVLCYFLATLSNFARGFLITYLVIVADILLNSGFEGYQGLSTQILNSKKFDEAALVYFLYLVIGTIIFILSHMHNRKVDYL